MGPLHIKSPRQTFGLNDSATRIPHTLQQSAACACDQSIISLSQSPLWLQWEWGGGPTLQNMYRREINDDDLTVIRTTSLTADRWQPAFAIYAHGRWIWSKQNIMLLWIAQPVSVKFYTSQCLKTENIIKVKVNQDWHSLINLLINFFPNVGHLHPSPVVVEQS